MRRLVITFGLATLVVGCATKPPPSRDEVREQAFGTMDLQHPWKAGTAPTDAVRDDWLATFQDPVLDSLVKEAIANNRDLRIAAARVEQSAQYLVIAGAALKPWLGIVGTGGVKAGGGSDPSSALQGIVAAASWELDLWGRVRYGRNAAQSMYASAQADFEYARQSLAASVAKAWFSATQLSLDAAIAAEMVQSARLLQGFAEDRERVGAGTDSDTAVARANVHTADDAAQQLQFARGQALRALEVLLGRYPAAEVNARAALLGLPGPLPVGVPLQMLERRPDVIAAERRIAAAFNRVGEAKAARLPKITLNLSYGAYESEILQLKEDFENPTGGAGARLAAPIYQGGALNAQVEIRTLEQKEAVADYARIALRALSEVENALAANDSLSRRVSLLADAVSEQSRALDLTETRFRIGRADRRAIEQQRLTVANARMALVDVQAEQLAQRVNLHLALGGSFDIPERRAEAAP
jgi:multidrug efflux system outer membrane protein